MGTLTYIERLKNFQTKFAKQTFSSANKAKAYFTENKEEGNELCSLYEHFFNVELGNCTNRLLEAYLAVMDFKESDFKECPFKLFAGALIEDNITFDSTKAMSNYNITTEFALFHLHQNPKCLEKFQAFPDNWKQLVAKAYPKTSEAKEKN